MSAVWCIFSPVPYSPDLLNTEHSQRIYLSCTPQNQWILTFDVLQGALVLSFGARVCNAFAY